MAFTPHTRYIERPVKLSDEEKIQDFFKAVIKYIKKSCGGLTQKDGGWRKNNLNVFPAFQISKNWKIKKNFQKINFRGVLYHKLEAHRKIPT